MSESVLEYSNFVYKKERWIEAIEKRSDTFERKENIMLKKAGFAMIVMIMTAAFVLEANAQQLSKGGNTPGRDEKAKLQQEIKALGQEAQSLRNQITNIEESSKPVKERLKSIQERIREAYQEEQPLNEKIAKIEETTKPIRDQLKPIQEKIGEAYREQRRLLEEIARTEEPIIRPIREQLRQIMEKINADREKLRYLIRQKRHEEHN